MGNKKKSPQMVVGVAWYADAAVWSEMKTSAEDPELFEASFEEWEAMAGKAFDDVRRRMPGVVRYNIVPIEYRVWCLARGKLRNAESRSQFVADRLKNM